MRFVVRKKLFQRSADLRNFEVLSVMKLNLFTRYRCPSRDPACAGPRSGSRQKKTTLKFTRRGGIDPAIRWDKYSHTSLPY